MVQKYRCVCTIKHGEIFQWSVFSPAVRLDLNIRRERRRRREEQRWDKCMVSRFCFLFPSSILSDPSFHACHLYEFNALIVKNVDRNITVRWSKAWNDFCSVSRHTWSNFWCSNLHFCSNMLISGVFLCWTLSFFLTENVPVSTSGHCLGFTPPPPSIKHRFKTNYGLPALVLIPELQHWSLLSWIFPHFQMVIGRWGGC